MQSSFGALESLYCPGIHLASFSLLMSRSWKHMTFKKKKNWKHIYEGGSMKYKYKCMVELVLLFFCPVHRSIYPRRENAVAWNLHFYFHMNEQTNEWNGSVAAIYSDGVVFNFLRAYYSTIKGTFLKTVLRQFVSIELYWLSYSLV
jgi:hypothetical protein